MNAVFAAIGTELYTYLSPRDLLSLSRSNHHFAKDVRQKLFHICLQQLDELLKSKGDDNNEVRVEDDTIWTLSPSPPPPLSSETVAISKQHSFTSKSELAGHLLQKIKEANLRYDPPYNCINNDGSIGRRIPIDTLEETLALTKQSLNDESRWTTTAGTTDGSCESWYGRYTTDPAELWKPPTKPFQVGCRFRKALGRGRSRQCFIDYRLREMKKNSKKKAPSSASFLVGRNQFNNSNSKKNDKHNDLIREWARYLIAQKGVVGREWSWECNDEEEVGFMIYNAPSAGQGGRGQQQQQQQQQLEIRWTKRTVDEVPDLVEQYNSPQATHSPTNLLLAFGLSTGFG